MRKLLLLISLVGLISGCAGTQLKAPQQDTFAPSLVETKAPLAESTANEVPKVVPVATRLEINPLKDPNNILSKRSIYFDFDQFIIKPEYRNTIQAHANYLLNHPDARIRIEGNADDRGSREYNLALGQKRASSVKKVLNIMGVSDTKIETISYGEEKPKSYGDNEAALAENRRADIVYSDD